MPARSLPSTLPSRLPSAAHEETEIDRLPLPVPAALVARSVTMKVPEAVGVPEISPELAEIPTPAGSPVAANDEGLPDAVIW